MQEIACSLCSNNADMAIVDGLTYTICPECYNIHVAETDQYIRFTVTGDSSQLALVQRRLFIIAVAMNAIYAVYDEIYKKVKTKFD